MSTRDILYSVCQWTWGFLQSLLGLVVFLVCARDSHYRCRGAVVTEWKNDSGLSLGMFIFVPKGSSERLLKHEYGHTIQSLMLGPLFLLIIGIPSFLWASLPVCRKRRREKKISYYSFYPERWADKLGKAI